MTSALSVENRKPSVILKERTQPRGVPPGRLPSVHGVEGQGAGNPEAHCRGDDGPGHAEGGLAGPGIEALIGSGRRFYVAVERRKKDREARDKDYEEDSGQAEDEGPLEGEGHAFQHRLVEGDVVGVGKGLPEHQ